MSETTSDVERTFRELKEEIANYKPLSINLDTGLLELMKFKTVAG